jgi:hypothetical protein
MPRSPFPYDGLARRAVWKRAVADVAPADIDPQVAPPFTFDRTSKVASAGSCFAQRIAEALVARKYNYFVTEAGPASMDPAERARRTYGDYSARFGNIYTTVQLMQLFDRAFGRFTPADDIWERHAGGFVDANRPRVEPDGFPTREALLADRAEHLAAVRRMFDEADVFVFTLGLTESWRSTIDGTAYPAVPGRAFGTFDASAYAFDNIAVVENIETLRRFITALREVNPKVDVILTVSPVPLVATATDEHVLTATAYSKAVLRVAAEETARSFERVAYFASLEIVTGTFNEAAYFEADRRTVTPAGVDHVLRSFFRHFVTAPSAAELPPPPLPAAPVRRPSVLGAARPLTVVGAKDPCDQDELGAYIAREFSEKKKA